MSQIVENLTQLVGHIVARAEHPDLAGFDLVTIGVDEARPVEGRADLLAGVAGSKLDVEVRRALLGDAGAGASIRMRAARTGRGSVMAEPHPQPADFSVGSA